MHKSIVLIFFLVFSFQSCTDKIKELQQKPTDEKEENTQDTNLTAEEKFASIMLTDFLNESEDADLASYLEEEIFPKENDYTGASIVEISPSTWFLSFEKNGTVKNYILQKYLDFKTLESYFIMSETNLKTSEILFGKLSP